VGRASLRGQSCTCKLNWSRKPEGARSADRNHTILPTLHNFTYDADFYVTNAKITQVLEFDINMYMNAVGMIWGTQCRVTGGHEWDIWDNANANGCPLASPVTPTTKAGIT
jgi:hypothetical protein